MARYIDADALKEEVWVRPIALKDFQKSIVQTLIDEAPSIDIEPKRGEWIIHFDDLFPAESMQECSICHAEQIINGNDDNFCPNCGADMRAEQTEPITSGVIWTEEAVKDEPKSYTTWASTEPNLSDIPTTTEDCSMVEDEDLGVPYVEVNGKDADCPWK